MPPLQPCSDTSEATELCEAYRLYLKPVVKINVCVQLPQLKTPGQSISSWEVMDKLKKMIKSEAFTSLKVTKTTLEFIRFEGELERKSSMKTVLHRLESSTMKLSGFPDVLKVRAAPAKLKYPARHDWDSFFRDAKNVNEMKPGERPDTVYIQDLPSRWFADPASDPNKPSEHVVKAVFETFGEIRRLEIPSKTFNDKNNQTFGKINTFSFSQDLVFEAYVQYKEYMGFVKAMDALRGMKLLFKSDDGKSHMADIKVDFDRTRYLSDKAIRKRSMELEKLAIEQEILRKKKKAEEQAMIEMNSENDSLAGEKHHTLQEKRKADSEENMANKNKISREGEKPALRTKGTQQEKEVKPELGDQRATQAKHLLKELLRRCEASKKEKQKLALIERKRQKLLEKERKNKVDQKNEQPVTKTDSSASKQDSQMDKNKKTLPGKIKDEVFKHDDKEHVEEVSTQIASAPTVIRNEERLKSEETKQKELECKQRLEDAQLKQELLLKQEKLLRERLLKSLKARQERESEANREKLRKELAGKKVLKSVLVPTESRTEDQFSRHSPKLKSFCTKYRRK